MNPYLVEGEPPSLKLSVFCLLDVLGYSEFATEETGELLTSRFRNYHAALTRGAEILRASERQEWLAPMRGAFDAAVTAFTDNICIGFPIRFRDGEVEVGEVLRRIGSYQLEMANRGYFVRGAVSCGDIYIDDVAVFGAPLIEAHEAESRHASNPRIIMSPTARLFAEQHMRYYGNGAHAPLNSDLKRDEDGFWFVDYLESLMLAPDEGVFGEEEIGQHRDSVYRKLVEYSSRPTIRRKYEWVAAYHNWFCRKYEFYYGEGPLIPGIAPSENIDSITRDLAQIAR